jgi:hypothetical protein
MVILLYRPFHSTIARCARARAGHAPTVERIGPGAPGLTLGDQNAADPG